MERLRRVMTGRTLGSRMLAAVVAVPALLVALLVTHLVSEATAGDTHVAVEASAAANPDAIEPMLECLGDCGDANEVVEDACAVLGTVGVDHPAPADTVSVIPSRQSNDVAVPSGADQPAHVDLTRLSISRV